MRKCDFCKKASYCLGVYRNECIVRDYNGFCPQDTAGCGTLGAEEESLDLRYMIENEVEHKALDARVTDEAVRYIKNSDRLMEMLDYIVETAISACQ